MIRDTISQYKQLSLISRVGILLLLISLILCVGFLDFSPSLIFLVFLMTYLAFTRIDLLFYLLIFTIPFSINLDVTSSLTVDFPDEPIMWFLLPVIFLLLLSHKKIIPPEFWKSPIVGLIAVLYVWAMVTTLTSTELLPSVKYLIAKAWYIFSFLILAFLIFRNIKGMKITLVTFMVAFVIFLVYSLYKQYLNGFNFEKVNDAILPFYHNHVNFSATISMLIPFVILLIFTSSNQLNKLTLSFYLILLFVGLYFAYGRGAWLAVFVSASTYFAMRLRITKLAVIFAFFMVGSGIYWLSQDNKYIDYRPRFERTITHDNLADHIVGTFQGTDVSSMERVYRWIASVRMAGDNPVFGVGPNNFYNHYKGYVVNDFRTWVSRNMERSTSHNYFLLMLTEQGFPAMILYGILVFISLAYAQKIYNKAEDPLVKKIALAVACSLAAFYVNNFLSELIESDELGSLFYMCLAVLVVLDLHNRKVLKLFTSK